jgi:PAS domain S-box-containing protein
MSMVCTTKDDASFKRPPMATRGAFCLVAAYVGFAGLWVVLSDWLFSVFASSVFHFDPWHIVEDLLFVLVSAALLYAILFYRARSQAVYDRTFSIISDQSRDGIVLCDRMLRIIYANPATRNILGYGSDELVGHPIAEFLTEPSLALLYSHVAELADQTLIRRTWDVRHRDGRLLHIEAATQRLPDGSYLAIGTDMTETRLAVENAKAERQRLRALVRAIPDPVWLKDVDGVYTTCNPAFETFLNLPSEQILGRLDRELLGASNVDALRGTEQDILQRETPITVSQSLHHPDGSTAHFRITRNPVFDDHDKMIGVVGIARDVTEQQTAETAMRNGEAFTRAVLDASATQMAVVDRGGKIVAFNDAWTRFAQENSPLFDAQKTGVGSNFFAACHLGLDHSDAEQALAAANGVRAVLDGETTRFSMESACITEERELWFMMNATPLNIGTGGAVITYVDITSVKQAQKLQARFTRQLQALARMHQDIQEKERHHLSMELHDEIGQALAALTISLSSARQHGNASPECAAALGAAQEIVDGIARTTRDIARRLRPSLLDELGIRSALTWHIRNHALPPTVAIHFEQNIDAMRFPEALELACFRIVQEAITNALRHAEPRNIAVRITHAADQICLSVEDDGKGFDINAPAHEDDEQLSLGLIGIRERAASLGGQLEIHSQPNTGTKVNACLPIPIPA